MFGRMFVCEKCQFRCEKKSNYVLHTKTKKHRRLVPEDNPDDKMFCCDKCSKQYKTQSGLWKHQSNCQGSISKKMSKKESTKETPVPVAYIYPTATPTTEMLNMIYDLVKQNQEIKELLMKQNEQLLEYTNRPVIIQQHIQNNTTNNFSLNVFLQEKCKDAINMSDFVNNLHIGIGDLEMVGKIGYVEGISRIIMNELSSLDIYTRPIHCTDTKRETIYIKDRDKWTRDTENKEHTKKVIEKVANKNLNKIPEWRKQHPTADIIDSKEHELNMQIMIQSLGGLGGTTKEKTERNHDKIVKMLVKGICVNKELLLESI
jgi:hypothetical protein